MVIQKMSDNWWMLTSDDGVERLIWFGFTKGEVLGKFNSYVRSLDLDKIRYKPRERV